MFFFLDYTASRGGFSFSTSFTVTCCVFHVLSSHLVEELKDLALPLLQILLQHICFQVSPEPEVITTPPGSYNAVSWFCFCSVDGGEE